MPKKKKQKNLSERAKDVLEKYNDTLLLDRCVRRRYSVRYYRECEIYPHEIIYLYETANDLLDYYSSLRNLARAHHTSWWVIEMILLYSLEHAGERLDQTGWAMTFDVDSFLESDYNEINKLIRRWVGRPAEFISFMLRRQEMPF